MESILVKVFAIALALSQVTTRPEAVKTEFDPAQDQTEVVQILADGCTGMRQSFDIENLDLDDLIDTVMTDTQATAGDVQGFRGLKFRDLYLAYRQLCKKENAEKPVVDIGEVIAFYNKTVAGLPDHTQLKDLKLPGMTSVVDAKDKSFAELFEPDNRRIRVPLSEIPLHVQQAFVAAEDKRFYLHKGVDERSVIRAFIATLADPKKRQGGSTITQQVAKNLLVGDDVSYERKIREIIVASRVEKTLTKPEILEVYLNAIFLGRASWGIEMAARSYFNKRAKDLTITEGAFLAGLTKGPNFYNPDRHLDRAQERLAYVLDRLKEDGAIDDAQLRQAQAEKLRPVPFTRPRRVSGFHLVDHLRREAIGVAGVGSLTANSFTVHSTIVPELQRAAETALQDGLARYEQNAGRARYAGPEANLTEAIKRLRANPNTDTSKPIWQQALAAARLPLYDVHWPAAVVVEKTRGQGYESIRVGLTDGRVVPLSTASSEARRLLAVNDVIYVTVADSRTKTKDGKVHETTRVDMRLRPTVQGAAVVLENATGRILAMVGGFSYPLSQLNRTTQSRRQPGSSFKPMSYLAALSAGLQPNTLLQDSPITLPPIGNSRYATEKDWWSPKNYDGGSSGAMTLRRALENSKNLVTARLLDGAIAATPEQSLDTVCRLSIEARLYDKCERYYPFVLGAQPVRVLDMAAFYAAIANEGARPTPHVIESIEQDGNTVYRFTNKLVAMGSADRPAAFQLKTILQGVLARGTARSIGNLSPYVGGKTGTSDDENDAWFVGFSNEVTVAVWVGYDNAKGKRTLGGGQTGGKVAVPIFQPIMQAAWDLYTPRTVLRGPSPDASKQLVAMQIDLQSGERINSGTTRTERVYNSDGELVSTTTRGAAFTEYFRLDRAGKFVETQHRLVSRGDIYTSDGGDFWQRNFFGNDSDRSYRGDSRFDNRPDGRYDSRFPAPQPSPPGLFGLFAPLFQPQQRAAPPLPPPPQQAAPAQRQRRVEQPDVSRQRRVEQPDVSRQRRVEQPDAPRQRRVEPEFNWGQRRAF